MSRRFDFWEDPEIMDWDDEPMRNDDRCLPGVALITAIGAFAFCRPRHFNYGCRPRYFGGFGCYPYRFCYPRPCRPV